MNNVMNPMLMQRGRMMPMGGMRFPFMNPQMNPQMRLPYGIPMRNSMEMAMRGMNPRMGPPQMMGNMP